MDYILTLAQILLLTKIVMLVIMRRTPNSVAMVPHVPSRLPSHVANSYDPHTPAHSKQRGIFVKANKMKKGINTVQTTIARGSGLYVFITQINNSHPAQQDKRMNEANSALVQVR
jgi:hypothetical protein